MAQQTADRHPVADRPPRMTFEEFERWVPSGIQAEWVDGEAIILTTTARHVRLARLLTGLLTTFVAIFDLGEVFPAPFLMRARPGGPGREPDILVLLTPHLDRVHRLGVAGPVDFAVELLSAETAATDRVRKRQEYEAAGIPEYVIIDARDDHDEFTYLKLGPDGRYAPVTPDAAGRYHSTVLPGFWLDPRWFEESPLPDAEDLLFEIAPDKYDEWIAAKRRRRLGPGSGR